MTGPDVTQNNTVAALKWHQLLLSLHFMSIQKLLVCVRRQILIEAGAPLP